MSNVIEVDNLTFGYNEKLLLDHVSFTVEKGDYLGIMGPNGSAKTTLLKLILNILTPFCGDIKLLGEDIGRFKKWGSVGYISQRATAFNGSFPATVEEIVSANLYSKIGLFRRPNRQHREQVLNALEIVGMQDFRSRPIGNLSGGQQQKVFIARVLVTQPEIMFLDEPTSGIDAQSEEAVYCLLAKLNKELSITVVMVTHDIGAITVHANKLAFLTGKKVTMIDPKEGLTEDIITGLYGYNVNLYGRKHNCLNCRREVV